MKEYNKVLTIAGSDSGGGAGIQADIKTISALGCYASCAITAVTVQNTLGVEAVHAVPIEILKGQIASVLSDIGTDAVKIGMLHSSEVVRATRDMLDKFNAPNIVLDPVMVSTSGHKLIEDEAIESLTKILIPRARIITPNIPEAEILLGEKITSQEELPAFARKLSKLGGANKVSVFLKAGHLTDDNLQDVFYNAEDDEIYLLNSKRIYTPNTHGTGCTLSSAIAAGLAKGYSLHNAAIEAKHYISNAIEEGSTYSIGHGHGPVKHFWEFWK
ncbi:MAG: bifunctional hydroxymethylpyrimidine kinase/phosphomethylpyrimidine kinase [Bacteroidales bacterium]|nr:bifunctional hydroxymethylpyrimidine kinase/phosphomethylpyrimidine kinase [Bacteroidales bacterium]